MEQTNNYYEQGYATGYSDGQANRQKIIDDLLAERNNLMRTAREQEQQKIYLEGRLYEANRLIEELTPWTNDDSRSLV